LAWVLALAAEAQVLVLALAAEAQVLVLAFSVWA
jgi:hypothetical protein